MKNKLEHVSRSSALLASALAGWLTQSSALAGLAMFTLGLVSGNLLQLERHPVPALHATLLALAGGLLAARSNPGCAPWCWTACRTLATWAASCAALRQWGWRECPRKGRVAPS